jgi:hypothetical protein
MWRKEGKIEMWCHNIPIESIEDTELFVCPKCSKIYNSTEILAVIKMMMDNGQILL